MNEAIEAMREMVDKHLAMGLKARIHAKISDVEHELIECDRRIDELNAELKGRMAMNNFQYIVRYNMRYAMHVAVELCEQGDFDDVFEAVKWLMQERDPNWE